MNDLITERETLEERYLRQIFIRDQMAEFAKDPFVMTGADGIYYTDIDGKRYLDAIAGIFVASVGHGNRRVIDAIKVQLDTMAFAPVMHGTNALAIQLANKLAEIAPGNINSVKFCSGGSEANETAFKMARQYHKLNGHPNKYKIISRYQSWHGGTFAALSASGLTSRRVDSEPLAAGFIHVFPPYCYRCPFGKEYPSCDLTCAGLIEDTILMEDPETVAAVIVEPIGHTGGIIDPPSEYLPQLRELCNRHNVLLIFDEIITGMGRTGEMFAADTFGVVPDLICLGKGISGGYMPLSAVLCQRQIADKFWGDKTINPGFVSGHTYEANPIACAAGLATIGEIIEKDLCSNTRKIGNYLREGLERLRKHGIIGDIRGKGLFLGVEFVRNPASKEKFENDIPIGTLIGKRALTKGLLTRYDPHWMSLGPPLILTQEQADDIISILDDCIAEVLDEINT